MGGGELHLESSRQPGHSKEFFWCRHNSKEDHLSDLKVESAMICNLEIDHGKALKSCFLLKLQVWWWRYDLVTFGKKKKNNKKAVSFKK